jgi:hypothetical protein
MYCLGDLSGLWPISFAKERPSSKPLRRCMLVMPDAAECPCAKIVPSGNWKHAHRVATPTGHQRGSLRVRMSPAPPVRGAVSGRRWPSGRDVAHARRSVEHLCVKGDCGDTPSRSTRTTPIRPAWLPERHVTPDVTPRRRLGCHGHCRNAIRHRRSDIGRSSRPTLSMTGCNVKTIHVGFATISIRSAKSSVLNAGSRRCPRCNTVAWRHI